MGKMHDLPYHCDLSQSNFYVFVYSDNHYKQRRFNLYADVKFDVTKRFYKQPQGFYQQEIYRIVKHVKHAVIVMQTIFKFVEYEYEKWLVKRLESKPIGCP